jgi:arylsulfatase A-like enzyme
MYDSEDVPLPADPDGEVWDDVDVPKYIQHYLERDEWPSITEDIAREIVAHYYGMVSFIDDVMGRLLGCLEDEGIADETIVVFTSDHGDWLGDHSLWLKGAVHTRGVTRIPCIVRWPSVSEAGRSIDAPLSHVDLMPTLLDAAGLTPPKGVQGTSLRPVLSGVSSRPESPALIEHTHEHHEDDSEFMRQFSYVPGHSKGEMEYQVLKNVVNWTEDPIKLKSLVTDEHRLTHVTGIKREYGEVFNYRSDPEEQKNRWFDDPELRWDLESELLNVLFETEDPLPERKYPV